MNIRTDIVLLKYILYGYDTKRCIRAVKDGKHPQSKHWQRDNSGVAKKRRQAAFGFFSSVLSGTKIIQVTVVVFPPFQKSISSVLHQLLVRHLSSRIYFWIKLLT